MASTTISPITRIEGHLAVHLELSEGDGAPRRVTSARCAGEMFRGLEKLLRGRDPLDAQQITQRLCGVCPIAHALASVQAQEMAYGVQPTRNGRLLQNLIQASNYLQSHVRHFYHLAALDFVDIKAILKYAGKDRTLRDLRAWVEQAVASRDVFTAAPFLPRYEVDQYVTSDEANWGLIANYAQALEIRTVAREMAAVFGAKLPQSTSIVPTGVTQTPTIEHILAFRSRLEKVSRFIDDVYVPDVVTAAQAFPDYWNVGASYGNYLSYGVFREEEAVGLGAKTFLPGGTVIEGTPASLDPQRIQEFVANSRFSSASGRHPCEGETVPSPQKGYSRIKAPRYGGRPMEVGPLARLMVAYHSPEHARLRREVDQTLTSLNVPPEKMNSVLGRHLARALEATWIARRCRQWVDELEIDGAPARDFTLPQSARGFGLTEAPGGALGHWLVIEDYKISRYQCVVPTTWNCSPRDDKGVAGPVEKALEGTPIGDPNQPIEAGRVVRSFDPCMACAIH